MEYGLLGETLGHSFSPQIHRALADYDYQLYPTPPDAVEELFRIQGVEPQQGTLYARPDRVRTLS